MINDDTVKKIAGLARINLREEEIQPLAGDLQNILQYINQLEDLDLKDVEPTSHALPLHNVFRDDTVQPSLSQQETLASAADQANGSFKVPRIIES
ncbi:MAG: Asp-tRNA(Asn)/Glu-tRNA(Gln) amidotransferase subunit GatC [Candidatus Omnitrophota bacterium]